MWVFLLKEHAVSEVEQSLLFPVFLVLRHLSFQQGPQVPAHGAVEGRKIHSHKVPADREGFEVTKKETVQSEGFLTAL